MFCLFHLFAESIGLARQAQLGLEYAKSSIEGLRAWEWSSKSFEEDLIMSNSMDDFIKPNHCNLHTWFTNNLAYSEGFHEDCKHFSPPTEEQRYRFPIFP